MSKLLKYNHAIHFYLCCAIAFLLNFKILLPILIILLVINWLSNKSNIQKLRDLEHKKWLLLFISIYVYYVIAMLYTANQSYGWSDLQTKLSLLLFPILFSSFSLTSSEVKNVLLCFIAGSLIASLFLLTRACYLYFTQQLHYFFYTDFSYLVHPSYFGMYINFALVLLFGNLLSIESKSARIFGIVFLTFILVLLSSKLALLCTFFIFIYYGAKKIIQTKDYKLGTTSLLVFIAACFVLINSVPELKGRIQNLYIALNTENIDKTNSESNAVRLLVWDASIDALAKNGIFGAGTGDIKDELYIQYKALGYTGALEHKLNAHNQFLQTGIALGFLGLAILFLQFIYSALFSWKHKNNLYLAFVVLVVVNFLTESMLETEAGVIFIGFFQSFLFFQPLKNCLTSQTKIYDPIFTPTN